MRLRLSIDALWRLTNWQSSQQRRKEFEEGDCGAVSSQCPPPVFEEGDCGAVSSPCLPPLFTTDRNVVETVDRSGSCSSVSLACSPPLRRRRWGERVPNVTRQAGGGISVFYLVDNLSYEPPLHWDMRESISLSLSSTDRRRELEGKFHT